MNLELTFSALQLFVRHINQSSIQKHLPELASLLQAQMQDPNQAANLEKKISETRRILSTIRLYEEQTRVVQNVYDQFGLKPFSSSEFLEQVDEALSKQASIAVAEVNKINEQLSKAIKQINPFIASLENFEIDDFEIEEALLTITLPKQFGFEDLDKFNKEIGSIVKTLGYFQELTVGERSDIILVSLSSSDPTVFTKLLNSATLLCVLECSQAVLDTTYKALEVYQKIEEVREAGEDAAQGKNKETFVEEYIQRKLNEKAKELAAQYPQKGGRKGTEPSELAKQAMEGLRKHIDAGACIEAQVSFEEEEVSEETTDADGDSTSITRKISNYTQSINYMPGENCALKVLEDKSKTAKKDEEVKEKVAATEKNSEKSTESKSADGKSEEV
jgi:hypothetical protein